MSDTDSAGVYYLSVEEFEARTEVGPPPATPRPRWWQWVAVALRRQIRRLVPSDAPPPRAGPGGS